MDTVPMALHMPPRVVAVRNEIERSALPVAHLPDGVKVAPARARV
jgi:hypothetical protein